jgi:hypothetical protein
VSDENISNIERQWAADEERRRLGACVPSAPPRPVQSAMERAQAERLEAARALPDALFQEDAQVQALHATHAARLAVSANQTTIHRWLMTERKRLTALIGAAEKALAWMSLTDGAQQDRGFAQTRAKLAALASDKALVSVIDSSLALLALPPNANHHIANEVDRAHQALNERLFELKLSHIDGAKE